MKRFLSLAICFVLATVLLLSSVSIAVADTITLTAGVYNAGKDFPAGEYEILCIEASDPYNEYLDLMKSLSGDDESLQSLWSLYGSLADDPTVTVTIRYASGEKKKSFELEKNAKRTITLEDGFSIKIEDGTCTLELKKEIASTTNSDNTSRTATSSDEWTCPNCNNTATGNFCNNCGTARPTESTNDSSASENDDIIGKWLGTHIVYNGVTVDISTYNMNVSMELSADGRATLFSSDGEEEGTWSRNADVITISSEGEDVSGTIEDGRITLNYAGNSIIFSRELTASSVELPSPITANSEEEFFGTWNMSRVAAQGVVLTSVELAAMGSNEDITFTISRGEARADIITNGKQDYNKFSTSFSNGRLQLKSTINSVAFVAVLTDSGELFITTTSDGITRQIYFTKEGEESSNSEVIVNTSSTPAPTEVPVPTETPSSEAKQETTEKQFSFMPDRWSLYKASATSKTSWKIEKWSRWNASTDDFKFDYDVGSFDVNDSSYGFTWTDESQSAFFITLNDSRNSDLDQERIGFVVNAETVPDSALLTFTNDRWAQYRAYILSPSTVKIECWGRWNASTDEFEHYYDVCVVNPNDPASGFVWTDDTHSAFFVTMEDKKNDNWKRDSAKVGFSVDPASITDTSLFTFTNDRWAQYRAYAITPSLIKIECWGRWNASTDDFEHYYDIGVVDVNDPSSDFSWTDDTHLAFFVTMEDEQNDNWKRESEKIGFSVDPETIPNVAQYTYLHDNWNLYKAYAISPNMIRIALWGRWNYNTDDFELYYDIGTIQVDDPTNDFEWTNNSFTAFTTSIIDYNNDDLDELTKVSFEFDKKSGSVSAMVTTAPKVTVTAPPATENSKLELESSIGIPDSQKDIEANWNGSDFRYKVNSDGTATLTKYSGNAKTLIVAEEIDGHPIKEIGERTFSHNKYLESVIIPSNVSIIGEHAFSYADKLEEVTILGPVEKIKDNAFYSCTRLKAITICGSNATIGERAFSHCSKLKDVTIVGTISEISKHAFSYSDKLESVSPIIGLLKLKENAFYNCTSLKSIKVSGQNLVIEERAFSHCSSIKDITVAGSISRIDTHAFSYCSKLEELTLGAGITKIGNSAFTSCSRLKKINYCGSKDEWNAINVGSYNRPLDSATITYDYSVPNLTNNSEPETTEQISASTNKESHEATSSPTPGIDQTETEENQAASTTTTYTDIKWSGELGYVITDNNSALIVDCSPNADSVSISSEIGGLTVAGIGDGAFEGCTKLKDVYIWADITSIGNNAFKGCSSLEEISIPSSVKTIGVSAFENCSELENAYIWGDPELIPDNAFKNCVKLEEISIPSGTKAIGISAFEGCINLENAYIWGDSEIGDYAFKGCTSLTEISISSGIETIGISAFAGCTSLKDVYIWGDTDISAYAFQGCTSIEEISISSGVDLIDDYAFEGCTNLREVLVWGNNTYISDTAFLNCPNLSRIPKSSNTTKPSKKETTIKSTPTPAPESTSTPVPTATNEPTSTPVPTSSSEKGNTDAKASDIVGKKAHLEAGKYVGGDDIPAGKYVLICKTEKKDSGIVWLAKDTDDLDKEYPSILYEFVGKNEERKFFLSIGNGYILNCPFGCDLAPCDTIAFENGIAQIETGKYTFGDDLPVGKYILVCETDKNNSGIVWLAKDTDDLSNNYPSILYEFIGKNSTKKYYINAGNNYILDCPFPCTLIESNTLSFENDSITIEPGRYVFGDDLPSGKYILTCNTTSQDSGIVWLAKDTDNLDQEYPSLLYEFVGKNDQDKFSINVKDGYILNCPFGCTLTKSQGVNFN